MVITAVLHAEHNARHVWRPGPGSGLGHRPGRGDGAPEKAAWRPHALPHLTAAPAEVLQCALMDEGDLEEHGNVELVEKRLHDAFAGGQLEDLVHGTGYLQKTVRCSSQCMDVPATLPELAGWGVREVEVRRHSELTEAPGQSPLPGCLARGPAPAAPWVPLCFVAWASQLFVSRAKGPAGPGGLASCPQLPGPNLAACLGQAAALPGAAQQGRSRRGGRRTESGRAGVGCVPVRSGAPAVHVALLGSGSQPP